MSFLYCFERFPLILDYSLPSQAICLCVLERKLCSSLYANCFTRAFALAGAHAQENFSGAFRLAWLIAGWREGGTCDNAAPAIYHFTILPVPGTDRCSGPANLESTEQGPVQGPVA